MKRLKELFMKPITFGILIVISGLLQISMILIEASEKESPEPVRPHVLEFTHDGCQFLVLYRYTRPGYAIEKSGTMIHKPTCSNPFHR